VFALGLYPQEAMRKTELAALMYQELVSTARAPLVATGAPAPGTQRSLAATAAPAGGTR